MAKYKVAFRVDHVVFNAILATKEAAFGQAKAWADAGLTEVSISDGEKEYSLEDFAKNFLNEETGDQSDTSRA